MFGVFNQLAIGEWLAALAFFVSCFMCFVSLVPDAGDWQCIGIQTIPVVKELQYAYRSEECVQRESESDW